MFISSMYRRFLDYCDTQENRGAKWFLLPLMTLSGLIMPVGIFLMTYFDLPGFLVYVAGSVLLFIGILVLNIAKASTRIIIPIYLLTILFNVLFSLFSALLS